MMKRMLGLNMMNHCWWKPEEARKVEWTWGLPEWQSRQRPQCLARCPPVLQRWYSDDNIDTLSIYLCHHYIIFVITISPLSSLYYPCHHYVYHLCRHFIICVIIKQCKGLTWKRSPHPGMKSGVLKNQRRIRMEKRTSTWDQSDIYNHRAIFSSVSAISNHQSDIYTIIIQQTGDKFAFFHVRSPAPHEGSYFQALHTWGEELPSLHNTQSHLHNSTFINDAHFHLPK